MADGAEQDGRELAQLRHHAVRQHLAGAQVAVAAEVVVRVVELEPNFAAAASSTLMASRTTSGPVPSPPMTAIL